MRLTDSQKRGLLILLERERAAGASNPRAAWGGAREGVSGTTLEALANRGLAIVQWTDKPYRRLVGRLTQAGIAKARELSAVLA